MNVKKMMIKWGSAAGFMFVMYGFLLLLILS